MGPENLQPQLTDRYYINGCVFGFSSDKGYNLIGSPLQKPGVNIHLVYGTPFILQGRGFVHPNKAFELIRYFDEEGQIHVMKYDDPANSIWGMNRNAEKVPTTPELDEIFDFYLIEWLKEIKAKHGNVRRKLDDIIEALSRGENIKIDSVFAREGINNQLKDGHCLLTEVEVKGIDEILEDIKITPPEMPFIINP